MIKINEMLAPKVGLGVLIFNTSGQILLGKRQNAHGASSWGPPGGHLEFGESLEDCAIREVLEETGLCIENPTFLAITNDFFTLENKHYVSIFMRARFPEAQKVKILEPEKVEKWCFVSLDELPDLLFLPLKQLLQGQAYGGSLNPHKQILEELKVREPNY